MKRKSSRFAPGFLVTFLILMCGSPAVASDIRVISDTHISEDDPAVRHVESVLKANPRNSNNLIAASILFAERTGVAVYASHDGGKTWVRGMHGKNKDRIFDDIDPALAFDSEGNAYLVTTKPAVWKSTDGGITWGEPATVPGAGYDRTFIACDHSGTVYVSAKMPLSVYDHPGADLIALSWSTDGGASFRFPKLLLLPPEKQKVNLVSDLLVTPDRKIVLVLQTYGPQDLNAALLTASYSTIVSTDGGRSFSHPRPVADFRTYGHSNEGKSLYGAGQGYLAIDSSNGTRRGWLYLTWLDVIDGYYQVMAASSADGGNTWSVPVQVNDGRTQTDNSNPAIAVNDQGVVGISWNDRRTDPTDRCYQLFFAASSDGGKTFSANHLVNEQLTCPIAAASEATSDPCTCNDPIASEYRFKNGGDTQGIIGVAGGAFHLAWINGGPGEMQLWSTVIRVSEK